MTNNQKLTKKQRIGLARAILGGSSMIEIEEGIFVEPQFADRFAPKIQKQIKRKLAKMN